MLVEQHVGRLEVKVQHGRRAAVQVVDPARHLPGQPQHLARGRVRVRARARIRVRVRVTVRVRVRVRVRVEVRLSAHHEQARRR